MQMRKEIKLTHKLLNYQCIFIKIDEFNLIFIIFDRININFFGKIKKKNFNLNIYYHFIWL